MNGNLLNKEDMVNNPTIRVPVCLCLDTSGSMDGNPIKELNDGVKLFFDSIKEDEAAVYSAEICIVTFGDKGARCIRDFAGVYAYDEIPKMKADGYTPMGEAVNIGLNKLEEMKQLYKAKGIDYYQPWLVLMTDGRPNGDPAELEKAIQKTVQLVGDKKLTVFPIGIGNEADMNTLARFSPLRAPLKLKGLRFKEFFAWLSQSVSRVSQSALGESIMLDTAGIQGWGEL